MKNVIALSALAGIAAAASAQTATVSVSTSATQVFAGESFTVSVTATGSNQIFGYNMLISALQGAGLIDSLSDLVHNPSGSSNFFGAPAGAGIDGTTVDTRDATAGILISPLPLDGLTFFSFTVNTAAGGSGLIEFGSGRGSGGTAALQFPDTSVPPIVLGQDYTSIDFGSASVNVIVPAPAGLAVLGLGGLVATRRRR